MKIKKIIKNGNRYKILLDNNQTITTYDDIIIKNNILYKKELTEKLINKIDSENEFYDIYDKTIKYINTKIRSEYEIRKYLEKHQNYKEDIINKLKTSGLINDKRFAKAYIHDKLNFTNDGIYKIKKQLQNHQIDDDTIEEIINEVDKETYLEKLKKMILTKIKQNTKYSNNFLKQKLLIYFINLGYDKEDILTIVENNVLDNQSIILKEYNRLYNNLKDKYEEEKLYYAIKNKLYQKGFKIEEIDDILKR